MKTYEDQLAELRKLYRTATKSQRKIIELQARALQNAIHLRDKRAGELKET